MSFRTLVMVDPRLPNNKPEKCLKLRFLIFSRRFCRETVAPPRHQPLRKDAQRDCNSRASLCPRQRLFYLSSVPAEKVNVETRKWTQLGFGLFFRPLLFPLGSNPNTKIVFFCWKNFGNKKFFEKHYRALPGKSQRTGKTNHMHASFVKRHIYLRFAKTFKKLTSKFLL